MLRCQHNNALALTARYYSDAVGDNGSLSHPAPLHPRAGLPFPASRYCKMLAHGQCPAAATSVWGPRWPASPAPLTCSASVAEGTVL